MGNWITIERIISDYFSGGKYQLSKFNFAMLLNENLKTYLENCLSQQISVPVNIREILAIGGGSINYAYCLNTNAGKFFAKINNASKFPEMFTAEARGLELLAETNTFNIPNVIKVGDFENVSFILMEFIEAGKCVKNFFADFGSKLATLHQHTNIYFGLNHDNYIGSLKQSNIQQKNGVMFFIHERLQVQIALAEQNRMIDSSTIEQFEKLYGKLETILPKEKSSLLHGDLWSGNFMTSPGGKACLVDPAVYYGNREADIAMSKLFGGFDNDFYESYNATFPLIKGWEQRIDVWNLYPLLVHVNLFGGGYVAQVKSILKRFC
ncbi:MAG: fructosamine kinase family protein [Bacteroidia bacterium]